MQRQRPSHGRPELHRLLQKVDTCRPSRSWPQGWESPSRYRLISDTRECGMLSSAATLSTHICIASMACTACPHRTSLLTSCQALEAVMQQVVRAKCLSTQCMPCRNAAGWMHGRVCEDPTAGSMPNVHIGVKQGQITVAVHSRTDVNRTHMRLHHEGTPEELPSLAWLCWSRCWCEPCAP